ncbi:hypothetical protein [Aeromicrobium sp. 50.2.37]|uniref:hypothetical protein n=1 Tax=Aeromicrobium sp. 50.2.37 TaxID=2969305 RepID=UPI00214FEFFE|nr:hypothetical protein [Aeromicrobium sp. 50.2.37]MCR4512636.1 hypothetical protein [Aeromicrobium sp. 50.2.37]
MPSEKTLRAYENRIEAVLSADARTWLAGQDLLTGAEVGELLGIRSPDKVLQRLRDGGKLVAVPVRAGHLYPAFQFRPDERRLCPAVARVSAGLSRSWAERVEHWAAQDGRACEG